MLITIALIIIILIIIYYGYIKKEDIANAVCILDSVNNNNIKNIKGLIYLDKLRNGHTHIYGKILGLEPGIHAFHIHDSGNLTIGCKSLRGHFNPYNKTHSGRLVRDKNNKLKINANRHVGDLGNIRANRDGIAHINFTDDLVKLDGKYTVIGRSLVIHEGRDDLGLGGTKESLKTGSAGRRIACGIIGYK